MSFFKEVVEQTQVNCPMFETLLGDGIFANRVACGLFEALSCFGWVCRVLVGRLGLIFCLSRMRLFAVKV